MSEFFEYDYELSFTNNFDLDVIEYSVLEDKNNNDFIDLIKGTVDNILSILSLQPGITSMSTFVDFNNKKYKVALNKII